MRPFSFCAFRGIDGSILTTNDDTRLATERDMDGFWIRAEPHLDRLTMELCKEERKAGNRLPDWLMAAEYDAFKRSQSRAKRLEELTYQMV